MASQKQQYTILYGRLSQEDERAGESNSILHQRALLESYAQAKGFENTLFLADDGYSGTNFERPSWKKIVEMIEAGEVSTLIVKDTSRLGREYLQVGYYMEIYFPQKNVRFIAVNDGVDSAVESSNDFNPIRNWANELHAKDTSRKVRAVKKLQAERGERLGGKPPYGYKTSEADPTHLEPDAEAAEVVRQIFTLCASGKGPSQIARILTERNILTPANYYFQKTGKTHEGRDAMHPCTWSGTTVSDILKNVMYLGHTVGLRRTTISYKNKARIDQPESEKCLAKNTHQPLITQEQWEIVQEVRQHKKRMAKHMDEPNIFSGLVFCADCGKPILTGSDKQGSFRPDSTIVRSEVAAILIRMYDASARAVHTEIIFNQANERVRTLSESVQSFLGNSWYSTAYDQTFIDDPTVSIDLGTCPS